MAKVQLRYQVLYDPKYWSYDKLEASIKQMKVQKAVGPGGLAKDLIEHQPFTVMAVLLKVFNQDGWMAS